MTERLDPGTPICEFCGKEKCDCGKDPELAKAVQWLTARLAAQQKSGAGGGE